MEELNKINKKEVILGLAIITFCITMWTILEPPVIETTLEVSITPICDINVRTDNNGNVKVEVR